MSNKTKVITGPETRWRYVNVFEPKSINGGPEKFSVSLVISKDDTDTMDKVRTAVEDAYYAGLPRLKGDDNKIPELSEINSPIHDGDVERPGDEVYANAYFINATSTSAPGIVDAKCKTITDKEEVYSGVYGRASITLYAYNYNGNRGIAAGLNNLQKISDGEPLGSRSSAVEDFAEYDDDDFLK